jgi:glycosyltransferase involved in cell wall biosynthesis
VHRRIFDAGIRFDETMKLGYEDWDFWLTAAERGFRGAQDPHFGLRYRNRGESMLSQAHRDDAEIQAYLLRKHRPLLSRRSLMRLEAIEAPRYAILFTDTNEVLLTTGSSDPATVMPQAEFDDLIWRNIVLPAGQYVPPFLVLMTRATFDLLSQFGLLRWILYDSELSLKEMNISCFVVNPSPGNAIDVRQGGRVGHSDILALTRELASAIVRDADTIWIEQVLSPDETMKLTTKTITIPHPPGFASKARGTAPFEFLVRVLAWRASPFSAASRHSWTWREFSVPPPHSLFSRVRAAFGNEVVYPSPSEAAKNIGFVLPIASFGGVERVAYNLAQQFAEAGWRTHFFVIGQTHIEVPAEFRGSMASINLLNDEAFGGWDSRSEYQGTALSAARNSPHATNRIVAATAWLDAVVNCHSGEFNAAAAELRQLGVKTLAHVHLLDMSPWGRSAGHSMITLAYEHAYDLIVCSSHELMSWMHGAGIPLEKLVCVLNAPGHPVDAARRGITLASRTSLSSRRLNVLYLGRLDRQKGTDRLAEVVARTREIDLPIDWRIVGAPVTGDMTIPPILQRFLQPAIFESEELTSLFSWADVMLLLSDYEGVPLAVLEAQRLGVVVIATNVGSLSEIVSHGKNGFLVDREAAVEQTLDLLNLLIEMPLLRSKIAMASSEVVEWPQAAAPLIARVNALTGTGHAPESHDPLSKRAGAHPGAASRSG